MLGRRPLLAGAAGLAVARADSSGAHSSGAVTEAPSLARLAARRGVLFGTAVTEDPFAHDPAYAALIAREAAAVTPEMALKWSTLRPSPDRFDFGPADRLLAQASRDGLAMRGHNLVWHLSLPPWLAETRSGAFGPILQTHIETVCRRYAGRVYAWDVVNEPIRIDDGILGGLRDTIFLRRLGPGYIAAALRMAAAADPHARLVINEMDLEFDGVYFERRREAFLTLLRRLRADGVPLHAVGIESHLKWRQGAFDPERFGAFLDAIAALGLEIHLTEFDVADFRLRADTGARDAAVADLMRRYLAAALARRAVRVVSVWELTDRWSWLSSSEWTRRGDGLRARGCLYDDAFNAKPARAAVAEAFTRS